MGIHINRKNGKCKNLLTQMYPTVIGKTSKEKNNRLFQQIQAEQLEKNTICSLANANLIPY